MRTLIVGTTLRSAIQVTVKILRAVIIQILAKKKKKFVMITMIALQIFVYPGEVVITSPLLDVTTLMITMMFPLLVLQIQYHLMIVLLFLLLILKICTQ